MARSHFTKAVIRRVSGAPADGVVSVFKTGTAIPLAQTVYAADTGATALVNPFPFTKGLVDFYLDQPARVRLVITPTGSAAQTFDDVDVVTPPILPRVVKADSFIATVSNKALNTNVATITTTTAHGFSLGRKVIISGVDATFNGTYIIASIPTTTTFTYSKTAGNVTSVTATGTAKSSIQNSNLQEWQDGDDRAGVSVDAFLRLVVRPGVGAGPSSPTESGAHVEPRVATGQALVVRGLAAQTGDLQLWQNSAGQNLALVNALGDGVFRLVVANRHMIIGDDLRTADGGYIGGRISIVGRDGEIAAIFRYGGPGVGPITLFQAGDGMFMGGFSSERDPNLQTTGLTLNFQYIGDRTLLAGPPDSGGAGRRVVTIPN